jgi:hypothetical protein
MRRFLILAVALMIVFELLALAAAGAQDRTTIALSAGSSVQLNVQLFPGTTP